jgi:hypothetical protein
MPAGIGWRPSNFTSTATTISNPLHDNIDRIASRATAHIAMETEWNADVEAIEQRFANLVTRAPELMSQPVDDPAAGRFTTVGKLIDRNVAAEDETVTSAKTIRSTRRGLTKPTRPY